MRVYKHSLRKEATVIRCNPREAQLPLARFLSTV